MRKFRFKFTQQVQEQESNFRFSGYKSPALKHHSQYISLDKDP